MPANSSTGSAKPGAGLLDRHDHIAAVARAERNAIGPAGGNPVSTIVCTKLPDEDVPECAQQSRAADLPIAEGAGWHRAANCELIPARRRWPPRASMRTQPLRILPQHDERVADIAAVTAAAALARRRPLLTTVHKTDRALANNSRLPPRTHPECAACQRRNKAPRSPLHRVAMLSRAILPPNRNGTTCPSPLEQDTIGNILLEAMRLVAFLFADRKGTGSRLSHLTR